MNLRDQLRRLQARAAPAATGAEAAPQAAAASPIAATHARPTQIQEWRADAVTRRELRFPLALKHGDRPLADILAVDAERLGIVARTGAPFHPGDAVFLDTETSDLAGGASVYVFLVGLLFVEQDAIMVEQIRLDGPEGEGLFLETVAAAVARRDKIISFSGKSFDRHRLDDRFALLCGTRPMVELPHLDLYHLGRRLFAGRLRDTRLRTFEERLLGVHRVDDLGGAECPEAWFDFLEGFDDGRMERVHEHNLIDVLSLVTLTARLDDALARPRDGLEAARAGLLFEAAGCAVRAEAGYRRVLGDLVPGSWRLDRDRRKAAMQLARLCRRRGEAEEALCILERLAGAVPDDPESVLAASRIAERDLRDRGRALSYAYQHRQRLLSRGGGPQRAEQLVEAARRIERLGGRISS